jgi:hypothetical protein
MMMKKYFDGGFRLEILPQLDIDFSPPLWGGLFFGDIVKLIKLGY